jgi:GNAT superfamily N-acetyltransferase
VRPDDEARLRSALGKLEQTTIYMRFFGHKNELTNIELEQATNVDFDQVVALWATAGASHAETIIAGARYVRDPDPASRRAEVAFTVEEDYQGQGIARCLLAHLVDIARGKVCCGLMPTCLRTTSRCSPFSRGVDCRCSGKVQTVLSTSRSVSTPGRLGIIWPRNLYRNAATQQAVTARPRRP